MDPVVHFEIPFKDKERGMKFYQEVFGWHMHDIPEMKYVMVHSGPTNHENGMPEQPGFINGGMLQGSEAPETPYPVIVMSSEDCEASLKKAEDAGAEIVMPAKKVGDMGIYGRVKDPEGNLIGIWQTLKN